MFKVRCVAEGGSEVSSEKFADKEAAQENYDRWAGFSGPRKVTAELVDPDGNVLASKELSSEHPFNAWNRR